MLKGVLEGVRVVDFTRVISGPYCTMYLSDMGADVIKIETPDIGDVMRHQSPAKNGECGFFIIYNRGKKSVTLNLKEERGKEIARKLIKEADVVVENFSPGTMKDLDLDYENMRKINPRLVYASISGYGQFGPEANLPSYDICIQGMCGLMSMNGPRGGEPTRIGMSITDILCGTATALAIVAALFNRERTGKGQYIDTSLFDSGVAALENAVPRYTMLGEVAVALGSRHPSAAPHNVFKTKDGYVIIIVIEDGAWKRLCKAMKRPELAEKPEFATARERLKNVDLVEDVVLKWTMSMNSDDVIQALKANNLAYGKVRTVKEMLEGEHVKARNMLVYVNQPKAGKVGIPGCPIHFSETPVKIDRPAPQLGEHTKEVLKEILGYSEKEIETLYKTGVV